VIITTGMATLANEDFNLFRMNTLISGPYLILKPICFRRNDGRVRQEKRGVVATPPKLSYISYK
jgi:hypothetical protein